MAAIGSPEPFEDFPLHPETELEPIREAGIPASLSDRAERSAMAIPTVRPKSTSGGTVAKKER